jgi:hypothetical protein
MGNDKTIVNVKLRTLWKEVIVAYFKVVYKHVSRLIGTFLSYLWRSFLCIGYEILIERVILNFE